MLVFKERVLNVPVMSLETGTEIARTARPIIDPRYLQIRAFYCEGRRLDHSPSVLHVEDIREVSDLGFIVNNATNLMSPDDLVRLKEVINFNFELDNKLVVDDHRRKIGKVANYTVDNKSFRIMQLSVTPRFWEAIGTTEIQIGRQQIIEITDREIIVKSPTEKAAAAVKAAPRQIVENPFRHARPQPDGISVDDD